MAISMYSVALVLGLFFWFYVTMRIKGSIERRLTNFGELLIFVFYVAGLVGVLVVVSRFVTT